MKKIIFICFFVLVACGDENSSVDFAPDLDLSDPLAVRVTCTEVSSAEVAAETSPFECFNEVQNTTNRVEVKCHDEKMELLYPTAERSEFYSVDTCLKFSCSRNGKFMHIDLCE